MEVGITCEGSLDQLPHNYCCTARKKHRSNCYNVIDGSFERTFSLALGLYRIPLPSIFVSENHRRMLYLLLPAKREQLKDAIQLEYDHIMRMLTRDCIDTEVLRTEYDIAVNLSQLVAPIHRLPVELLASIFSLIPDEQNQKIDILVRTCCRWKEIVSSIWAPLKLATWTSLDEVKGMLEGSNGLFSITIDPDSDTADCPKGAVEVERYAAVMLAVSTSTVRWKTLDILSLPDPHQTNDFFEGQRHAVNISPMNHLRSLSIPIRHDSSQFLDLLLQSVGSSTSFQLTDMHLCSVQAISYFAQPRCAQVFNCLTSFKCFIPQTEDIFDILPRFWRLEILDVSGIRFLASAPDVELPLTKTLRQMSIRAGPIGWMNHRKFQQLESCTIISPPALDAIPITSLPLCTRLYSQGLRFDAIQGFNMPSIHTLTLLSPQWSKSRGDQLLRIWQPRLVEGFSHLVSLHLCLTCSDAQLSLALCSIPSLKELVLTLDRPTSLGSQFFVGFLPPSLRRKGTYGWRRRGDEPLQACPSLETMGLKYRRWFRTGESNEMPALVAMVHLMGERDRKINAWVEKGACDQERVHISSVQLSTSVLCSLGLLRLFDGVELSSLVVRDVIRVFQGALHLQYTKSCPWEAMIYASPAIYSCLFQRLRNFSLNFGVDQGLLLEALDHFGCLEDLYAERISLPSPQPHLRLLRTIKKMELGSTSLLWMEGCTFIKLEKLVIRKIEGKIRDQFQRIQMPVCKFASIPQYIPSDMLKAFYIPQLRTLDLHLRHWRPQRTYTPSEGIFICPSIQQFRLHTASFCFVGITPLRDALETQPELELLEIEWKFEPDEAELLKFLEEPCKVYGRSHYDDYVGPPKQELYACPRLKELKLQFICGENWRRPEVIRRCLTFLKRRMETGCPLQRCLLEWGTPPSRIDRVTLP